MIAIHSNWSKPFFEKYAMPNKDYMMPDYEIILTIYSALKWRQYNGNIKMVTDSVCKEYYEKLSITDIWDLGIDTYLDNIGEDYDARRLWSIGKIFALKTQEPPFVTMDTDLIVNEKIEDACWENKLFAIHTESAAAERKKLLLAEMKPGYIPDPEWDWNVNEPNAGFLYFNDKSFVDYYFKEAIKFLDFTDIKIDSTIHTSFADQNLIALCAKKMNIEIKTYVDLAEIRKQTRFTHIWRYKKTLDLNKQIRTDFCITFLKKILTDFPERKNMIYNMEIFHKYLEVIA